MEAGGNHNGVLSIAKYMIDIAVRAGCDDELGDAILELRGKPCHLYGRRKKMRS